MGQNKKESLWTNPPKIMTCQSEVSGCQCPRVTGDIALSSSDVYLCLVKSV